MKYYSKLSFSVIVKIISLFFQSIKYIKNWFIIPTYFFGNKNESKLVKLRNGLLFITNKNILDLAVIIENFSNESNYDYFLKKEKKINPKIIDIGAHIGTFSIYAAKKYPKSMIYCYEPDFQNYEKIIKNVEQNNIKNVKCFNSAVGKINGKIHLYSVEKGDFGTTLSSTVRKSNRSVEVSCATLENVFMANKIDCCDLLKLDCEGAEYQIIFDSPKNIFKKIKSIALEYHDDPKFKGEDLVRYLKENGFYTILSSNKRDNRWGLIYAKNQRKNIEK